MSSTTTGTLRLPSLQDPSRYISMSDISIEEASAYITEFSARVPLERKLKKSPNATITPDPFITYNIVDNIEDFLLDDIFDLLEKSKITGAKGNRAVFVDAYTNTILVGTTVVYNKNWAMVNFVDDTIIDVLLDIEAHI